MNIKVLEAKKHMMSAFYRDKRFLLLLGAESGLSIVDIMNTITGKSSSNKKVLALYTIFVDKVETKVLNIINNEEDNHLSQKQK